MSIGRPLMYEERIHDVVVLSPNADLTIPSVLNELERAATRLLASTDSGDSVRAVCLDLNGVSLLPSVAVGTLLQLRRKASEAGKHFILLGVHRRVASTLSILGVDDILTRRENVTAALAALDA